MTVKKRKKIRRVKVSEKPGNEINVLIDQLMDVVSDTGAPYQTRVEAGEGVRKAIETREGLMSLWTTKLEDLKFTDRIYG